MAELEVVTTPLIPGTTNCVPDTPENRESGLVTVEKVALPDREIKTDKDGNRVASIKK